MQIRRFYTPLPLIALAVILPASLPAMEKLQGWCQQGNAIVTTSGLLSSTKVQGSYPSCTVTVYLAGTITLATIYADNSLTPKANPFTAASDGTWFFYAANTRYDVAFSGAGMTSRTDGDYSLFDESTLWLDVQSCGAKGDGATDDSTAINTCITKLNSAGGGVLYFPKANYCVSSSVVLQSKVSLLGPRIAPTYAGSNGQPQALIQTCGAFSGTYVVDARLTNDTTIENMAIYGNGTRNQTSTDATTTGLAYGQIGLDPGCTNVTARHWLKNSWIAYNKYGVQATCVGTLNWLYNNIGNNWYTEVWFDQYGGNDGTYVGNNINTTNWNATGIADPVAELYSGTGLYLGFGCTAMNWIGGKIEYNRQGIVLNSAFKNTFSNIQFDANGSWHIRIRGNQTWDTTQTLDNKFIGLQFNGGAYDTNLQGLDAHILVEGYLTAFVPTPVSLDITGATFRSAYPGSVYPQDQQYPKYPQNNIIATHVLGSGAGLPDFRISCTGCDFSFGSVLTGTANIVGTSVTSTSGPQFQNSWVGKQMWINYYQPLKIVSVNSPTSITLNGAPGDGSFNWLFETNNILLDPNLASWSTIRVTGGNTPNVPWNITKSTQDQTAALTWGTGNGAGGGTIAVPGTLNADGGITVPYLELTGLNSSPAVGNRLKSMLHTNAAWGSSVGTLGTGTCAYTNISMTGARIGDAAMVSIQDSLLADGWIVIGKVINDNVRLSLCNLSGGNLTIGNESFSITVLQY